MTLDGARVARNIGANFAGSVWSGLMALAFIPLYIRYMGIESYGLVGFFATLQSVLMLLDFGLSTTINREFARLSAVDDGEETRRRLLRTFETIYWAVGLVGGIVVVASAHLIAVRWVNAEHLTHSVEQHAVALMGVTIALQWPFALYAGALLGAQRQVELNVINAVAATLRGGGAVAVLAFISPTVTAFFVWQAVISVGNTVAAAAVIWSELGSPASGAFDRRLLRSVWRFAAGMVGIGVLSTALTQVDKLVVSKVLPLQTFGYYALAATVAASLYRLVTPVFAALFPRFSQLVAAGDEPRMRDLYHRSSAGMSAAILPAAIFTAFFARELMLLWTRNASTAAATHGLLSAMIVGTAFNGLSNVPYAVQLAYGWTRLSLVFNIVAVTLLLPLMFWLATRHGAQGVALGWLFYNVAGFAVVPLVMHGRVLRGEQTRFYLTDVGLPLLLSVFICAAARMLIVSAQPIVSLLAQLGVTAVVVQAAAVLSIAEVRSWIGGQLRRRDALT